MKKKFVEPDVERFDFLLTENIAASYNFGGYTLSIDLWQYNDGGEGDLETTCSTYIIGSDADFLNLTAPDPNMNAAEYRTWLLSFLSYTTLYPNEIGTCLTSYEVPPEQNNAAFAFGTIRIF